MLHHFFNKTAFFGVKLSKLTAKQAVHSLRVRVRVFDDHIESPGLPHMGSARPPDDGVCVEAGDTGRTTMISSAGEKGKRGREQRQDGSSI